MDYTTFDSSKNLTEDDFQECLNEKRIRQDIENLTVEEFISALLDTIDKDTTVDMIEDNLLRAIRMIWRILLIGWEKWNRDVRI